MMRTYTIELLKKVPIAETDEAKWLVDTGCPFSYPNHIVTIGETMASFLGIPSLRMLGLDKLGSYILVDYPKGTIICSDEPIPFEETSVPLMIIETDWVVRVCGDTFPNFCVIAKFESR